MRLVVVAVVVLATSCSAEATEIRVHAGCADVVDVELSGDGLRYDISVTVESSDTGWDKYADEWQVRTPDGEVLATRELAHPHVDEQPFTRSLSGVPIPGDVAEVVVAARDSVAGYCGTVLISPVPGRS